MRFSNVVTPDGPRLGLLHQGTLCDLSSAFQREGLDVTSTDALVRQGGSLPAGLDPASLPPLDVRAFRPAVTDPEKIICVGRNYKAHIEGAKVEVPDAPCLFAKYRCSLNAHEGDIVPPVGTERLDYEGELALVIGEGGRNIPEDEAFAHIFGYTVANDISARDLQRRTPQWLSGKSPDTFCPVGPHLVSADEVRNPQDLAIQTRLNGETVQSSRTSFMIFPIRELIHEISRLMTLAPGDIILTGTPAGTQLEQDSPHWLQTGDVVEVDVEGIGTLKNTVRFP